MLDNKQKEHCSGCSACFNICPKGAISMVPDALGFLYPIVDDKRCIKCGLCEKVCSFSDDYIKPNDFSAPYAFGARHKNLNEVETSRSGAIFIAVSEWIISQGGTVYGAGYTGHFRVAHKRACDKTGIDEFKGSKYVQSDVCDVFAKVRDDLKAGLYVLFSGTSCQVAGIQSYLRRSAINYLDRFYAIDIVCHGVPGPFIWKKYLEYLETKEEDCAISVSFRDKDLFGWRAHKESVTFKNKGKIPYSSYTYLFYQHIMFRHSCRVCHFANIKKPGDITIADFWGWQKTNENANKDDKGISLILCNSKKGKDLFEKVQESLDWFPVELEKCLQPNLKHPSVINKKRMMFERDFEKYGIEYVMKKYGDMGWRYKMKKKYMAIKNFVKKVIRR